MAKPVKELEADLMQILTSEKVNWELGTTFITERIAFRNRDLIREVRKNYYGVFNQPIDPVTGRRKTYVPLTESLVEAAVKNIDLDTKDITVKAKPTGRLGLVDLARNIIKNSLDEIYFGEFLDDMERRLAIDGTCVWWTGEKDGKIDIRQVDLLNFYIDPSVRSINEAEAVMERIVMDVSSAKSMAKRGKWENQKDIVGHLGVDRYDGEFNAGNINETGQTKMVEVWKRTGLISKKFFSGSEKDEDVLVSAEVIASGQGSPSVFHDIRIAPKTKPYEEFWYTRVPNRWHGKGVGEKVMPLQIWMNTVINIRIGKHYVSQLGLFKIKRNRGITPQMVNRLGASGAILVDDQEDIEQFVMKEASSSSYADEDRIQGWAERVTSAFETVTGETLPASTTATTSAIQSRSAESQFTLIKEGIGNSLIRWMERQAMPVMNKQVKKEDVIRLTFDDNRLAELNENLANELLIRDMKKRSGIFDPVQVEQERQRVIRKLNNMGSERYVKLLKSIDLTQYDLGIHVTNEKIDKGVLLQNLIQTLQLLGNIPGITPDIIFSNVRQIYDSMGLTPPKFNLNQQPLNQEEVPQDQKQLTGATTQQQNVTRANVIGQR